MSPVLTHSEIDAAALPEGITAGQRPSDADILVGTPWRSDLPLADRQRMWRDRSTDMGRRMVAVLAARHGWTPAQIAAAESVTLDMPSNGIDKRGRMVPVDPVAVYTLAADRA